MTNPNKPKFISFEGVEGVGKSTNIQYFAKLFITNNIDVLMTREPGGTPVGEAVRDVLLKDYTEDMMPDTEALLFYAARAQHVEHRIKPAIAKGSWVLCDRFFDATLAYQGGGRQVDLERLKSLNQWTLGDFKPDVTILLDAPVEVGLERIAQRNALDRIEKEKVEFFERVRACYLDFAKKEPKRFRIVDASQSIEGVQAQLDTLFDEIVHG